MWIGQHKDIETYIVLDDLDLKNNVIQSNLIMTDSKIGLSEENVLEATHNQIKEANRLSNFI